MVSLMGERVLGSPFSVVVCDPTPYAPRCEVKGDALNSVIARTPSIFEIRYRDMGGSIAQAVDLDLYVVPLDSELEEVAQGAWDVATHTLTKEEEAVQVSKEDAEDGEGLPSKKRSVKGKKGKGKAKGASPSESFKQPEGETNTTDGSDGGMADVGLNASEGDAETAPEAQGAIDELLSYGDQVANRRRIFLIQALDRPLVVREEAALDSSIITQLQHSQMATVLEERISDNGKYVRARIAFDNAAPLSKSDESDDYSRHIEHPHLEDRIPPSFDALPASSSLNRLLSGRSAESPNPKNLLARREIAVTEQREPARRTTGWATLRKNGKNLVTSRVRLDPQVRQQAALLWKLQSLNDKLQLDLQTEAALLDKTGVGFAFGGVYPGQLHSKGQVLPAHKVSYSVDRVGKYLLHVRLRHQARPVPGSPFALEVKPGAAHYAATYLEANVRPLRGEVGLESENGSSIVLQAHDRVGNMCMEGAANISTSSHANVVCSCEDRGDGTYMLSWRSKFTGTYDAKVMINSEHVLGSPIQIQLTSTVPDVSKTVVSGAGLRMATAGVPVSVRIQLHDQFDNPATPGPAWKIGMAIDDGKTKTKLMDLSQWNDFEGSWVDADAGEYEILYTAQHAGVSELHLWATKEPSKDQGASPPPREALPGSPFVIHVVAGEPTPGMSFVSGLNLADAEKKKASKESKTKAGDGKVTTDSMSATTITAGDAVSVRVHGIDEFNNAALLSETALQAVLLAPDGREMPLSVVDTAKRSAQQMKESKSSASKNQYEVRHEVTLSGPHEIRVYLHGKQILDSPVAFDVVPNAPTPQQSTLAPPENAEALTADMETPALATIRTNDKYEQTGLTATHPPRLASRCGVLP